MDTFMWEVQGHREQNEWYFHVFSHFSFIWNTLPPCLISGWQHIRLPCTTMTASTKRRAWESRCGPEHSQRSWDQQFCSCKNKYSALCLVLGHWQGRGESGKGGQGPGDGEERRGLKKRQSEGEGDEETECVSFFIPFPCGNITSFRAFTLGQLCAFVRSKTLF